MKTIKPQKLSKGDLIGVISPASLPDDMSRVEKGVKYLESLGYRVEVGKNVGKERGYLAGNDAERLEDLHYMFRKKEVKAVFCVRGGYGSGRLLEKINYHLIRKNPKIFVGYSDLTVLHLAFYQKAGLVTFGGPMVAVDFSDPDPFTEENFWKIITAGKKIGKIYNPDGENFFVLNKGRAEGKLLGGNLALLVSIIGSQYLPSFNNSILLLEEIGEAPYRIDRMFNQLKIAGILRKVGGILLGRFVDCYDSDVTKKTLSLNEVIGDYLDTLKKPVFYNIKHGHVRQNLTLPFGINCKINTSRGFIEFTESAVI